MLRILLFAPLVLLGGCATVPETDPQARFWQALRQHCGKAYAGRMVSDEAADAEMRGMAMIMHVRECSAERIAVPFHVQRADGSWDRSRTWVLTRTGSNGAGGLRLKHDHRHQDGSSDVLTMYGGDTASKGTSRTQDFPVDAESKALFTLENRAVSLTNVWTIELDPPGMPGAAFTYRLRRAPPNTRDFRVAFDLTRPIGPPPAPWGQD